MSRFAGVIVATMLLVLGCRGKYVRDFVPSSIDTGDEFATPERVTAGIESSFSPNLSPNGAFVLYTSDRKGNKDLWEKKTNGGYPIQLTTHPADDFNPVISPDGKLAAFVSRRDNALGDVHILELGESFSKLLGRYEGDVHRIEAEKTEDNWPTWFADSKRIVFSSRQVASQDSYLYWANIKELKAQPLDDLAGEQPAVSPDDRYLAFVRGGNIWLYEFETKKKWQLTDGKGIQDGQPSFSPDGRQLVFLRYSEDTNGDDRIDSDDRSTIWKLDIQAQLEGKDKRESFYAHQLTASSYSAFRPSIRPPYLFFARQNQEGVDIFRLPENGEILHLTSVAAAQTYIAEAESTSERIFILRYGQAALAAQKKWQDVLTLAISELEILLEEGRSIEAEWLKERLTRRFPTHKSVHMYATLVTDELSVKPLLSRKKGARLSSEDRDKLTRILRKSNRIIQRFNSGADRDLHVRARLLAAKLYVKLGEPRKADQLLSELASDDPDQDHYNTAKALLYRAQLSSELSDISVAMNHTMEVAYRYKKLPLIVEAAANLAIELARGSADELVLLQNQLSRSEGLMPYAAIIHERIIAIHQASRRELVAANELREMRRAYRSDLRYFYSSSLKLATFLEASGSLKEAEDIYKELTSSLGPDRRRLKLAQAALSEFYLRKAERFLGQQDPKRAEKEYRRVLKGDWRNVAAHVGLIDSLYMQSKLEREAQEYKRLYEENPRDPRHIFYIVYISTYSLLGADDDQTKTDIIDKGIKLLEEARQRNGQIPQIHQTLGMLYYNKGLLEEKALEKETFSASLARGWRLFQDYIGFGDPVWYEQSVDSYLSAYFTAKEGSVTRVMLSEQLGDAFFRLQNHSRSLFYYMQRLQHASSTPIRSAATEAKIYRLAGKAAFYTEDLDVALALQKKEVTVWEKVGDKNGIARAMDSMALTLREMGNFDKAYEIYGDLLLIQSSLSSSENIAQTYLNLGYCANQIGKYDLALEHLESAENQLNINDSVGAANSVGVISLDIGGQGSDAKGFDRTTKKILIETLRVEVYTALRRLDLALTHQKSKYETMLLKQEAGRKNGRSESYYIEEVSVALNQIGTLSARQGDYRGAAQAFLASADMAAKMRPPGRTYPVRSEWVNLINYGRTVVRLKQSGDITKTELDNAQKRIHTTVAELKKGYEEGDVSVGKVLAMMNLVAGHLSADGKNFFAESRTLMTKVGANEQELAEMMLAYDFSSLEKNDKDLRSVFRRSFLADDSLSFKFYARLAMWDEALKSADRHIEAGRILPTPGDRRLYKDVFELSMLEQSDVEKRRQALHAFLDNVAFEIGVRGVIGRAGSSEDLGRLRTLFARGRKNGSFADSLEPGMGVLVVYGYESGVWDFHFYTPSGVVSESGSVSHNALVDRLQSVFQNGPGTHSLVVVAGGSLPNLSWQQLASAAGIEGVSLAGSPALALTHLGSPITPKASLLHYDSQETPKGRSWLEATDQDRYYRRAETLLKANDESFNIIHNDNKLTINDIEPYYSVVALDNAQKQVLNLTQFSKQPFQRVGAYIFSNLHQHKKSDESFLANRGGWIAMEIAALMAGVPTVILANDDSRVRWQGFYRSINEETYANAFARAHLEGFVVGHPGISKAKELAYAEEAMTQLVSKGEDALQAHEYGKATSIYKEALYYAKKLGRSSYESRLIESLIEALLLKRDYPRALALQKEIIASAAHGADNERLSGEYLMGSILAYQAGELEESRQLLERAREMKPFETLAASERERRLLHEVDLTAAEGSVDKAVALLEAGAEFLSPSAFLVRKLTIMRREARLNRQVIVEAEASISRQQFSSELAVIYLNALLDAGEIGKAFEFSQSESSAYLPVEKIVDLAGMGGRAHLAEKILKEKTSENVPESTRVLMSATQLMRQRAYDKALSQLVKFFYRDAITEEYSKAQVARLIAICHEQLGNLGLAQSFITSAEQLARNTQDRNLLADVLLEAGRIAAAAQSFDLAVGKLKEAQVAFKDQSNHAARQSVLLGLSLVQMRTDAKQSARLAREALDLARELGHKRQIWRSVAVLARHGTVEQSLVGESIRDFISARDPVELRYEDPLFEDSALSNEFLKLALQSTKDVSERFLIVDAHLGRSLRSDKSPTSVTGLLRWARSEQSCLLEFLQLENRIHRFYISPEGIKERLISVDPHDFAQTVASYASVMESYGSYEQLAAELRGIVLDDIDVVNCQNLVIAPHGPLHRISFGQLLDQKRQSPRVYYAVNLTSLLTEREVFAAPTALQIIRDEGEELDSLAALQLEYARTQISEQGRGFTFDLRDRTVGTTTTKSTGSADVSEVSTGIPQGDVYFGTKYQFNGNALSQEPVSMLAADLAIKGYRLGFFANWTTDPIALALFDKHMLRELMAGKGVQEATVEVRRKLQKIYTHPVSWAGTKPYLFDLSLLSQEREVTH